MILISAMSKDHIIGNVKGDGMPWNVPEEYQQFLDFIKDQAVIIGRKSFEIFQADMPSAFNFVVSSSSQPIKNATVCSSLEEAIDKAKTTKRQVYIAGGASIYHQALPHVDKMYISYIHGDFEGNTTFPDFNEEDWTIVSEENHPKFKFVIYKKKEK